VLQQIEQIANGLIEADPTAAETKLSANRQMGLTGCKYIFRQSP